MTEINVGTVNVINGKATKEYTIPSSFKVGKSTIRAIYLQNGKYQRGEATSIATIKIPTTLTVSNTLGSKDETGVFKATVSDTVNNTNVSEGQVQFKLNGANYGSPVTATNGEFILNETIPSNASTGDVITATYMGTDTYGGCNSTTNGTLTLRKNINLTIQTISANRGSTPTIQCTATDENGDIVQVGTAVLYIDNQQYGGNVEIDSTTGKFTFTTYTIDNNATVGSHTIRVEYIKNEQFNANTGTGTLIVRTPTVITAVDTSANPDEQNVIISVNVRDNDNHDINEGTVEISIGNDGAVSSAVANGTASITYNVPSDASGTIQFTAKYLENTNMMGSETVTSGIITIRKAVTVTVEDINATVQDTINLSATVTSGGVDVDEGEIKFSISDKTKELY